MQSCTQWVHAPLPLQNPPRAYPVTLASWLRTDYGRSQAALRATDKRHNIQG